MSLFLLIIGPGSLFAYIFAALAENFLTYSFDLRYYKLGRAKSFKYNPSRLKTLHKNCFGPKPEQANEPQLIRIPLGLGFGRLLILGDQAQVKMSYYFWLAQPFILGTALLNYIHGNTQDLLLFVGGCEFLFGGFHIQTWLKLRQFAQSISEPNNGQETNTREDSSKA